MTICKGTNPGMCSFRGRNSTLFPGVAESSEITGLCYSLALVEIAGNLISN